MNKKHTSILPNCFSPLISLKTVNEQRQRKVGELLWLSNYRDSVGLVRRQAASRPYLSPMIAAPLPICITVFHSKLCWTTKKLSLCILYFLCSNVCRLFFHVGSVLSCMHISSTDKKHPSCRPLLCLWCPLYYIHVCVSVQTLNLKIKISTSAISANCLRIAILYFSLEIIRDTNILSVLHTAKKEPGFKADQITFHTCFRW